MCFIQDHIDYISSLLGLQMILSWYSISTELNACSQQPCLNGGTCVQSEDCRFYGCECPECYSGNNCEIGR